MEKEQIYIQNLSKMINIPTISNGSFRDESKFKEFRDLLRELFPHIFKLLKYEEFEGSILLSYIVNNNLDPILLMSHYDVVSCENNWTYNPFNATLVNGKLYGRGTLDTKGNLWAILTSIEELIIEGHEFKRSIYIESACNEETTGEGAYLISRTLKERGVHFLFTLDEGGMIVYDPIGCADGNFAMIALGEKDYLDFKFIAKSKGGHSSTPDKNNPILRLSKLVCYFESHNIFKPKLQKTTAKMLNCLSLKMKGFLKFIFKNTGIFKKLIAKELVKFSPTGASMVKTTICFCMAKGSEGYNIIPEEAYMTGNVRVAHHDKKEDVIEKITKIAAKFGIEAEVIDNGYYSKVSSYETKEYKLLCETISSNFKDVIPTPYISNGASDSKYFSDLSENNFRFAPIFASNEQLDTMHAKDENINVSSLTPAVIFYKDLIKKA